MSLTMEIKKELRPCICNNKKALFHMWADEEQPFVKINAMLTDKALDRISSKIKDGIIPPYGGDVVTVKTVVGIVEFEDGTVEKVKPSEIRFADTEAIMNEYDFGERKD